MRRRLWLIEVARAPGPVEQRGDAVARPSKEDIAPVCVRRCASRARRSGWAALGDPTRRAIIQRIASRPCAVGEIARTMRNRQR